MPYAHCPQCYQMTDHWPCDCGYDPTVLEGQETLFDTDSGGGTTVTATTADVTFEPATHCPTCLRPYKTLEPHERARSGDHPGVEHEAARLNDDPAGACAKVLERLKVAAEFRGVNGWVSGAELRDCLGGGDGARRARQLRDEYGYPIAVEMRSNPRQAWYRLTGPRIVTENPDG